MEWMEQALLKGQYLYCAQGSHLAMYDDQQIYFTGLIKLLKSTE